jgi:hypothetical protein
MAGTRRSRRLQESAAGAVNGVEVQEHDDDGDEDFLEMDDECPCCRQLSTCEQNNCKRVVAELANNATSLALFNNYSGMDSYERISAISEQLLANPAHHRLQQFDLSGVCENFTSETTNLPSSQQNNNNDDEPPQDNDQQNHYGYLNFPGLEEFITNIAGTEGMTEELETLQQRLTSAIRIDTNVLQSDEEQAKYVITAALCVYNHNFRRLSEDECKQVMGDVLQRIQPHISLVIPDGVTATLYQVFANPGVTPSDNANVFTNELGAPFGRAYQNMAGQNGDGDDGSDDYYINEEDSEVSWNEEESDYEDDLDSEEEEEDEEELEESNGRRVRNRQN